MCGKEMADIKDSNISNYDIHHYSNRTCFLINDDFDYMIAVKNTTEEALGWKVLPEIVYHVEKEVSNSDQVGISMHPLFTKNNGASN